MSGILEAITAGVVSVVTYLSPVPQATLEEQIKCTGELYHMHLGAEAMKELDKIEDRDEYGKAYSARLKAYLDESKALCKIKS